MRRPALATSLYLGLAVGAAPAPGCGDNLEPFTVEALGVPPLVSYALTFTPSEFWKPGETYTLTIDLDALGVPENVVFNDSERQVTIGFNAKPLKVAFPTMKFMQEHLNAE